MRNTLLLILALVSFGSAAFAREFYVATDGRDDNPGTFAKPFATLERARDEVRRVKDEALDEGRITVYLRGGEYLRRKTFELTERDSGREATPIIYRAYPGEPVHLIGGHVLKPAWFTPVTANDPIWKRLDTAAQGQCLKIDLTAAGIKEYGDALQMELSFNGDLMQPARWPNEGFVKTTSAENDITFGYDDPRPARWQAATDAYAIGYWRHGWANRIERIARIDTASKRITLEKAPGSTAFSPRNRTTSSICSKRSTNRANGTSTARAVRSIFGLRRKSPAPTS